jgi:tetratricopeptide (TPR) repeat protein
MVLRNSVSDRSQASDGSLHTFYKDLGDSYALVNDYQRASECYARWAALAPTDPTPHLGMAAVAFAQKKLADSQRSFEHAIVLCPACSEAYGGLAMVHQHRGNYLQAQEMYLKCLELDSDNLVALLGLFQTSCSIGSFGRITSCLEVYLASHPTDTSVLFCLATLYGRDGRLDLAGECLERVLHLEPCKREAAVMLEQIRHALGATNDRPI